MVNKMAYRKYVTTDGKYGNVYNVAKGVTVRKDHRGVWTAFVEKGGIRKNRTFGKGREALVQAIKLAEAMAQNMDQVNTGSTSPDGSNYCPMFLQYSKDWFERKKKTWKGSTRERYEGVLVKDIWPHTIFKNKRLDQITRAVMKGFLEGIYQNYSATTVEIVHCVISGIYTDAIDAEIVDKNPAHRILTNILPKKSERKQTTAKPFNKNDLDLFYRTAEKICSKGEVLILKMEGYAGLRLGESLTVRFKNIDFEKSQYYVKESYKRQKFDTPKNGKFRFVDLPDFLTEELRKYVMDLRKQKLVAGEKPIVDLLFEDPTKKDGFPYSQRKIQEAMKRVCKKTGLDMRSPHDLRHTYATILLMRDKSLVYVQKQLGHSSIQITADIYCHWIEGEGRDGLEEAFKPVRNRGEIAYLPHIKKERTVTP
jgi:integrase